MPAKQISTYTQNEQRSSRSGTSTPEPAYVTTVKSLMKWYADNAPKKWDGLCEEDKDHHGEEEDFASFLDATGYEYEHLRSQDPEYTSDPRFLKYELYKIVNGYFVAETCWEEYWTEDKKKEWADRAQEILQGCQY